MQPVMTDTKWDELRLAMHDLGDLKPRWRVRNMGTGYESAWDGDWYYHFCSGGYHSIEWAEIEITSPQQRQAVRKRLVAIHLPGEETELGFRIFGYVPAGTFVDYLSAAPKGR
jgi:hypothetical protein